MRETDTRTTAESTCPDLVERLFAPIESRVWAKTLAHDLGWGLIVVAVVQVSLALARGPQAVADAAIYGLVGGLLVLRPFRAAALLAVLTATASTALTVMALLGSTGPASGRNVVLSIVTLWIAGRALQATLAFRRLKVSPTPSPDAKQATPPDQLD